MNELENNFKEYLPINRKEIFYTATVLPSIICYENFKHINLFLKLINGFPKKVEINPNSTSNNIQFLTEYSLKESANFQERKIIELPESKETPDLVILITKPELYLIVIEAKMFSSCNINGFKEQIKGQEKIIKCLKSNFNIKNDNIFHIGLVPKKYFPSIKTSSNQILYWEDIISAYEHLLSENYFLETLRLAVNNYSELKATNKSNNMEARTPLNSNWHFSFLGKPYFEKIIEVLGYGGFDCPIQSVFTGSTGEEYVLKLEGRRISPNWAVILSDGKHFKYGKDTRNKLIEGAFNQPNYIETSWDDIKKYKW